MWEAKNESVLESVSRMIDDKNIQIQASLDVGFNNCDVSQYLISKTNKKCSYRWDSTLHVI
jgi:hypothetical protein